MEFLSDHTDSRFNIFVDDSEYSFDYTKLKVLNAIHPQVYIVTTLRRNQYKIFQKNNIKFYFNSEIPIDSFRMFEYVCSLGITDVYIQEDLCYNLKKVRKAADHFGVQIRLVLNHIPSLMPNKGTNVRSPWFIPETVDELDKYIDIVEFEDDS